jgi:CheY-like chemotaxis protein
LLHLRDGVRLLVEQTSAHHDSLDTLSLLSEPDGGPSYATAADAMNMHAHSGASPADEAWARSTADAATMRRLCAGAAEQHATACRLLAELEQDDDAGDGRGTVLVVDDRDEIRELVTRLLQHAGFVVRGAANGLEALIVAHEMRPRVIVMDVAMPVLDGIAATRLIKANAATRDARVIAYTGEQSFDSALVPTLFATVLRKPAPSDLVVATVQQLASQ